MTSKLSIYTAVQNGLRFDYHTVAMLKHHIPLVDEIIVNEGFSDDGTYEAISNLDEKVKVFRSTWDRSDPSTWHIKFKKAARQRCTGDWCILLDCDEFIPEWEFERLRSVIETTEKNILPVKFTHFYANYRVCSKRDPAQKTAPLLGNRIHRNLDAIEVWGDGANVWKSGEKYSPPAEALPFAFDVHHFGEVRHPARLRQKWRTQARQHNPEKPRWDWIPSFVFDLLPHRWADRECLPNLEVYDGPYIQAVRDDPDEFVRDGFEVYELMKKRSSSTNKNQ